MELQPLEEAKLVVPGEVELKAVVAAELQLSEAVVLEP